VITTSTPIAAAPATLSMRVDPGAERQRAPNDGAGEPT
jgi:hypothetical protein